MLFSVSVPPKKNYATKFSSIERKLQYAHQSSYALRKWKVLFFISMLKLYLMNYTDNMTVSLKYSVMQSLHTRIILDCSVDLWDYFWALAIVF